MKDEIRCSFCDKEGPEKLIRSALGHTHSNAYICNDCIYVCVGMLEEEAPSKATLIFGVRAKDVERMEARGFITLTGIKALDADSGKVIDFLLELRDLLTRAKEKLDEFDKTELGKAISEMSQEISRESAALDRKRTDLQMLQKRLADISTK